MGGEVMENEATPASSVGRLSYVPPDEERLVLRTADFILSHLPLWRDDVKREHYANEKRANSSLCDFLDHRARGSFPMVRFKHEAPQLADRTADLGVHGTDETTLIGTRGYTIYQPFMVIEAKRLPAPEKNREREYVSGTDKATGAMQRFKLGLHGADVETAVIVGYIEKESARYWHTTINRWISRLSANKVGGGWGEADKLGPIACNDEQGTGASESRHSRSHGCSKSIRLRHLWVEMGRRHVHRSG